MLLIADLDGTAIDTRKLIIASYQHVIRTYGLPVQTDEELGKHVGIPLKKLYPVWAPEPDMYPKMFETHRQFQADHLDLVKVIPGIPEVFSDLRRRGVKIGINTNRSVTGRDFIRLTGLESLVDHIVTVEDVRESKPAPEGIILAMRALNCDPGCTWMMGDTETDVQAGKNARVPTIGVDFTGIGYGFGDYIPDYHIKSPYEIIPILFE